MPVFLPPISRRDFLAGALAAGAALALGGCASDGGGPPDPNRFVLLADTHIWRHRDRVRCGVRPSECFAAARREILTLRPRPAGLIVAGDCACVDGQPDDYAVLAEDVRPIREAGIAIWLVLGNHDHRENFYSVFPDAKPEGEPPVPVKHVAVVPSPHADWLLLDSLHETNRSPGRLGEAQLQWLARTLDAKPDRPALVVAHHHPKSDSDDSGLEDTEPLLDTLKPRRQVKAYFYGHTHAWDHATNDGIHLVNVPTPVWLFDFTQPRAWLDAQLTPDGMALALHALDKGHAAHGQTLELAWRA